MLNYPKTALGPGRNPSYPAPLRSFPVSHSLLLRPRIPHRSLVRLATTALLPS